MRKIYIIGLMVALTLGALSGCSGNNKPMTPNQVGDAISKALCKRLATCNPQSGNETDCVSDISGNLNSFLAYNRDFTKTQITDCTTAIANGTCEQLSATKWSLSGCDFLGKWLYWWVPADSSQPKSATVSEKYEPAQVVHNISPNVKDICRSALPNGLALEVEKQFQNHRLPTVSDNLKKDSQFENNPENRDTCICVDSGDYDGNGQTDYAFVLTPKRHGGTMPLVVALSNNSQFKLQTLRVWEPGDWNVYVRTVRSGVYSRFEMDGPVSEKGEVLKIESRLPGVSSGNAESESSEVCYFMKNGKWFHVWTSD